MRIFRLMVLGVCSSLSLLIAPVWATQCPPSLNLPFRTEPCNNRLNNGRLFCNLTLFGNTGIGTGNLGGNSIDSFQSRRSLSGGITRVSFRVGGNFTEYFIGRMALLDNDEVTFNTGQTYYIRDLIVGRNVKFFVRQVSPGPARLILGNGVFFPQGVLFNSPNLTQSGNITQMLLYGHGAVTFDRRSAFSGELYSQGTLTVGDGSRLNGIISGAATCF